MGNCQNDNGKQSYHFKRKKIFPQKQKLQNILPFHSQENPEHQTKANLNSKPHINQSHLSALNDLANKKLQVMDYPENSLVKVRVSDLYPLNTSTPRLKVPQIGSDQIISLGQISNLEDKNMRFSIENMIKVFQREEKNNKSQKILNPDNGISVAGQYYSNSWGRSTRDQIGIKYTNSYYLSDEEDFADQK